MTVPALVLRAPGTNCDAETAYALERAGATATTLHLMRLIERPALLDEARIVVIPGGFSFGDDLAAGRVFATRLTRALGGRLRDFAEGGGLILGICNGFQVLLRTGLLEPATVPASVPGATASLSSSAPATGYGPGWDTAGQASSGTQRNVSFTESEVPAATLTWNTSGRYTDRWVHLRTVAGHRCVVLAGIDRLELPIAHAEGRFVVRDEPTAAALDDAGQLVLRYVEPELAGTGQAGPGLPYNPNGSTRNVAGLCDATGRIFGLMPHPERYLDRLHHPRWTRGEGRDPGDGLQLFVNAVEHFA